jgi:predicted  nucleic acid-binding Zn-ribbon protein
MSAQFVANLTAMSRELATLREALAALTERVEAIEAEAREHDIDIDALTVRPRGRPRKVQQ